jgi:hypothetical protein
MPEILRDEFGIAHARADSEADAFFAQGFACAEDRLWQMEHDRLRACGRWAEVVGADALVRDTFMRRLGLARSARRDFAQAMDAAANVDALVDTGAIGHGHCPPWLGHARLDLLLPRQYLGKLPPLVAGLFRCRRSLPGLLGRRQRNRSDGD